MKEGEGWYRPRKRASPSGMGRAGVVAAGVAAGGEVGVGLHASRRSKVSQRVALLMTTLALGGRERGGGGGGVGYCVWYNNNM